VIERIAGMVAARAADHVVVDVGGVGFLLDVSAVTLRDVAAVGEQTVLFTHLHVREDIMQLYGFSSEEERELFRLFLGVSKIGPKIALAALSCRRAADLKKALAAGDVALFASVPGIGKKTAERLILELREKMGDAGLAGGPGPAGGAAAEEGSLPLARAALVELGYSVLEAERLLSSLDAELPVEELIREALTKRV